MKKQKYDMDDFAGAIVVLENYLDGAVADYEDGQIENDYIIHSCINTLKLIYANTKPILLLFGNEYEERMKKKDENS